MQKIDILVRSFQLQQTLGQQVSSQKKIQSVIDTFLASLQKQYLQSNDVNKIVKSNNQILLLQNTLSECSIFNNSILDIQFSKFITITTFHKKIGQFESKVDLFSPIQDYMDKLYNKCGQQQKIEIQLCYKNYKLQSKNLWINEEIQNDINIEIKLFIIIRFVFNNTQYTLKAELQWSMSKIILLIGQKLKLYDTIIQLSNNKTIIDPDKYLYEYNIEGEILVQTPNMILYKIVKVSNDEKNKSQIIEININKNESIKTLGKIIIEKFQLINNTQITLKYQFKKSLNFDNTIIEEFIPYGALLELSYKECFIEVVLTDGRNSQPELDTIIKVSPNQNINCLNEKLGAKENQVIYIYEGKQLESNQSFHSQNISEKLYQLLKKENKNIMIQYKIQRGEPQIITVNFINKYSLQEKKFYCSINEEIKSKLNQLILDSTEVIQFEFENKQIDGSLTFKALGIPQQCQIVYYSKTTELIAYYEKKIHAEKFDRNVTLEQIENKFREILNVPKTYTLFKSDNKKKQKLSDLSFDGLKCVLLFDQLQLTDENQNKQNENNQEIQNSSQKQVQQQESEIKKDKITVEEDSFTLPTDKIQQNTIQKVQSIPINNNKKPIIFNNLNEQSSLAYNLYEQQTAEIQSNIKEEIVSITLQMISSQVKIIKQFNSNDTIQIVKDKCYQFQELQLQKNSKLQIEQNKQIIQDTFQLKYIEDKLLQIDEIITVTFDNTIIQQQRDLEVVLSQTIKQTISIYQLEEKQTYRYFFNDQQIENIYLTYYQLGIKNKDIIKQLKKQQDQIKITKQIEHLIPLKLYFNDKIYILNITNNLTIKGLKSFLYFSDDIEILRNNNSEKYNNKNQESIFREQSFLSECEVLEPQKIISSILPQGGDQLILQARFI